MKADIILPIYNPREWVFEAIDSVIAQTYSQWNLVIVDDCSPGSKHVISKIKRVADRNDGISYFRLEHNVGAAAARNRGISRHSGCFIALIDQDDRWYHRKLDQSIDILKHNKNAGLVHSNIDAINADGQPLPHVYDEENTIRNSILYSALGKDNLCSLLFRQNSIRIGTVVLRRDAFEEYGRFLEGMLGAEELAFVTRFASMFNIAHLNEITTSRRRHSNNVNRTRVREITYNKLEAVRMLAEEMPFLRRDAKKNRVNLLRRAIKLELMASNRGKAASLASHLIGVTPFAPLAYGLWVVAIAGLDPSAAGKCYRKLKSKTS